MGFITAQIKQVADTRVGDTITDERQAAAMQALPGFKPAQPVVFCGLFPVDAAEFDDLRAAMGRLRLNDASFSFEMEILRRARLRLPLRLSRPAAPRNHPGAAGARVQPRPHRDRAPSVVYEMKLRDGTTDQYCTTRPTCPTPRPDPGDRGTVDPRDHPDAGRLPRLGAQTLPGAARCAGRTELRRLAGDGRLRPAAERGGVRLLRPA